MHKLSDKKKVLVQVRRAMRRMDQNTIHSKEDMRRAIVVAVSDVYRQNGKTPDMEEIEQAVDQIMQDQDTSKTQDGTPKKKIPLHYWILGGIVAIPLVVPAVRLTEAIVMVLLRVVI